MKIRVKLFGHLREKLPQPDEGGALLELPECAKVSDLLSHLSLPPDAAPTIFINDHQQRLSDPLHEGDSVSLIPPLVGGKA
ncbi:MAG: MoaD/ThiS family protein [Nitrospinota bacterium]